ncbi:hypothetical protein [Streptomyces sp. Da 82-17]|uniref:hypothetical protein n=1 Tax=Streptomyces sp. Da 82-17 TaxID=3377116 RepID=UPI0038D41032
MSKTAKSTIKAAKSQIERDTRNSKDSTPHQTQGSLADRHVRMHTPASPYGDDSDK